MSHKPPSTARLEAFSDGVIAVIITIMVLELKVPHGNGVAGLYAVLPTLVVYMLSFAFTGIYWINHQHLLDRIDAADRPVLYANLTFLFFLSLLPFFTAYVLEKDLGSFAVALYAFSMMVTGFSFLLLRLAIHRDLKRSGNLSKQDQSAQGKHVASLFLYVIAIPLAFYHAVLALVIVGSVTVVWIIPNMAYPGHHRSPTSD
jgi:uncharacterized membrane protein